MRTLAGAPIQRNPNPNLGVSQTSNRVTTPAGVVAQDTPGGGTSTPASTDTQELTIIVPAATGNLPGAQRIDVPGISFYFPSISSRLGINARAINLGQSKNLNNFPQGTGLRFGTTGFAAVELQNVAATACTVTIVIGGGVPNQSYDEFIDKRVIIVNNPNSNVYIEWGPTLILGLKSRVPAWADSLANNATQVVTEDTTTFKGRKQAIICNNDAGSVLQVLDGNGNIAGTIQPSTAFTWEGGGSFSVKNNATGAPISCNISETYWT